MILESALLESTCERRRCTIKAIAMTRHERTAMISTDDVDDVAPPTIVEAFFALAALNAHMEDVELWALSSSLYLHAELRTLIVTLQPQ